MGILTSFTYLYIKQMPWYILKISWAFAAVLSTNLSEFLVKPSFCLFLSLKADSFLSGSLFPDSGAKKKALYKNAFTYIATYLVSSHLMACKYFLNHQTDSTFFWHILNAKRPCTKGAK